MPVSNKFIPELYEYSIIFRLFHYFFSERNHENAPHKLLAALIKRMETRFCCEHCPSSFTLKNNLTKHITTKHAEFVERYKCPNRKCGAFFTTTSNLKVHMNDIHSTQVDVSSLHAYCKVVKNTDPGKW